tara:strand:- start:20148 stop:21176 length:1029 start_codon:yes stop_codon:yes gene_type:complete
LQLPNTRWSDRFFLVFAICASLFAIFMHIGIASTQISRKEWAQPAKHIKKHFQKGDVIGLVPSWALKGAEQLPNLPVLYAEHLQREDLSRYKRLWVMLAPRLGKWWFVRSFQKELKTLKRLYWLRKKITFGPIELYLFQLPTSQKLLYDFSSKKHLRQAEVGIETPTRERRVRGCPASVTGQIDWLSRWREHPGWFLGKRRYFFGRIIQEIDNTPRDCLWVHALRCKVIRVRYRNVPLRGKLKLEHGFTTPAPGSVGPSVRVGGPDMMMSVWVDNRMVKRYRVSEKQIWREYGLDLSKLKSKHTHTKGSVEFRFHVPGLRANRVGYCFRASLRAHQAPPAKR